MEISKCDPSQTKPEGKLTIIASPMYSGKTTLLCREFHSAKRKYGARAVKVIKHPSDKRYHEFLISTHDGLTLTADNVRDLANINVRRIKEVLIDELHFFQ